MSVTESKELQTLNRLRAIVREHASVALASSLGAEDMVLTDMIERHELAIDLFTLDTGRLPEQTHALLARVRERYRGAVQVFAPEAADIEAFVGRHGANAFYDSVLLRRECCYLRKVKPLRRALAGRDAWITGQRRAQSPSRQDLAFAEWDAENALAKYNPLADWAADDVWDYLRRHQVPTNALHEAGYASIGCAPCTRAIAPGEPERAGRWWWEEPENKECGLHVRRQSS